MSEIPGQQIIAEQFNTVDDTQIKEPKMPVAVFIQESNDLLLWCRDDRKILESKGLDWSLAERLPEYLTALSNIQAQWINERNREQEIVKAWKEKHTEAIKLRRTIIRDFRFAFRNQHDLLRQIPNLLNGKSNAALIQDLNNLSIFGKAHLVELETIRFDQGLLEQAAESVKEMSALLASVNAFRKRQSELMLLRNKAYTICKNYADTIRITGKYVHDNDRVRRKGYTSEYRRKWNRLTKK